MANRTSRMRLRMALLIVAILGVMLLAALLSAAQGTAATPAAAAPAAATPAVAAPAAAAAPAARISIVRSVTSTGRPHVLAHTPGRAGGPHVLVVGDSTTVQMIDAFTAALQVRGVRATIDATSGRTTRQGRDVVRQHRSGAYDYVVVLLGANGKRENARRDMRALKTLGVDTVATVQTPRRGRVNAAVRRVFGAERIGWAGYAQRHHIRTIDGKHYTTSDYRVRARYLAEQIAQRAA